jgi:hypothetical protein
MAVVRDIDSRYFTLTMSTDQDAVTLFSKGFLLKNCTSCVVQDLNEMVGRRALGLYIKEIEI